MSETREKVKLTKAERATLEACPDWSAAWEVAARRRNATGVIVYARAARRMLDKLLDKGLVEHGTHNNVYRQAPAGRATLKETGNA